MKNTWIKGLKARRGCKKSLSSTSYLLTGINGRTVKEQLRKAQSPLLLLAQSSLEAASASIRLQREYEEVEQRLRAAALHYTYFAVLAKGHFAVHAGTVSLQKYHPPFEQEVTKRQRRKQSSW